MGARDKINSLQGFGILAIAGFIGAASHSWTVFFVIAVIMGGISVMSGDIRFNKRRRK